MDPADGPNPIKDALKAMLETQLVDDEINLLTKKRLELEARMKETQKKVDEAAASQETLKKSFDEQKKKRGMYELEVKTKEDEIVRHNSQLNDCKSNEAYTAKLNEIKSATDTKKSLEESILHLMENEETMNKEFTDMAAELDKKTKEAKSEADEARQAVAGIETSAAELKEKRDGFMKSILASHRETYNRRQAQRPKVISAVRDDQSCSNCSMRVPALQITELKKIRAFVHCQSCGVILVDPTLL